MYGLRSGYAKHDGMMLASKFLPNQVAFEAVEVIHSPDEWIKIEDQYGSKVLYRIDAPYGMVCPNINCGIDAENVLKDLREAQAVASAAAVLILKPRWPVVIRHQNQGSFCVDFDIPEQQITVKLAGKGFDGHELTRNGTAHESIVLPWKKARVNQQQWKEMFSSTHHVISRQDYASLQSERIRMLHTSSDFGINVLEVAIPLEYTPMIPSDLVRLLQQTVILPLMVQQKQLRKDGLMVFSVLGNFSGNIPQVWEMLRP